MVPVDAADGDAAKQKYYGMLKIKSDQKTMRSERLDVKT